MTTNQRKEDPHGKSKEGCGEEARSEEGSEEGPQEVRVALLGEGGSPSNFFRCIVRGCPCDLPHRSVRAGLRISSPRRKFLNVYSMRSRLLGSRTT